MPIVSITELCLAAQQQFRSEYQVVYEGAQKPFVAQLLPRGAAPPLYIAQHRTRMSVTKDPAQLDCSKARKLTRLLLHIIHLKRTNKQQNR